MSLSSEYVHSYNSFSGHDMICTFELPLSSTTSIARVVGSVQTISYSIHNEKMPVRVLGDMNPKNYVYGPRVIAGSLVFTVFDNHWLHDLLTEYLEKTGQIIRSLSDSIPPLNITLSFANEYGQKARLALYKVTFINEGQVMSINDMYIENTYEFYALDIDVISPVDSSIHNENYNKRNDRFKKNNASNVGVHSNLNLIDTPDQIELIPEKKKRETTNKKLESIVAKRKQDKKNELQEAKQKIIKESAVKD